MATTSSLRRTLTRRAEPAAKRTAPDSGGRPATDAARRHALICEAAYFRAQRRAFQPGCELDDWLLAESEVDRALRGGGSEAPAARESGA